MNAILLCAGFGTRLYPLTERQPKALLPIAGKPLVEYLLRRLETIPGLEKIILVSNGKFFNTFSDWKKRDSARNKLVLINDETLDNEGRLGAIRDLMLGLKTAGRQDDILVLASDNLFEAEFRSFVEFSLSKKPGISVGVYDVKDLALAQKYGLVKTGPSDKIVAFFEKPKDPPTTLASTGVYFFPKETFAWMDKYLEENKNPDAPGYYLSWLAGKVDLFAYRFPGIWFDIGDIHSYQKADRYFQEHTNR